MNDWRSRLTTHCPETALLLRTRCRRPIFFVMSVRMASVTATWRPVTVSFIPWRAPCASVQNLTLIGRRDLQLFAVLRDRPAREHEPLLLEDAHDLRITERTPLILGFDDLPDPLFDRHRRHALTERAADPTVEEELHLIHALWGVHVLVVHDARHRRLVHADVVGDVTQHERPQMLDTAVQEVALKVDDARRDLEDRLLALVHGLEKPQRRPELVLHVGARLVRRLAALVEQAAIHRAA